MDLISTVSDCVCVPGFGWLYLLDVSVCLRFNVFVLFVVF